jgi:uncharacterized membrane protein YtjA (UPF0391 family)
MIFLLTAIITGLFGFIGPAGVGAGMAQILSFVLLAVWALTLFARRNTA